ADADEGDARGVVAAEDGRARGVEPADLPADDGEREAVAALAAERRVDEVEEAVAPRAEAARLVVQAPRPARLDGGVAGQPERVGQRPRHLLGGDEDGPAALGEADEPPRLGLVRRERAGEE